MAHSEKNFLIVLKKRKTKGISRVMEKERPGWQLSSCPGERRRMKISRKDEKKKQPNKLKLIYWVGQKVHSGFSLRYYRKAWLHFFRLNQYYCIRRLFSALSEHLRITCMCVCTGVQYMQRYTLNISNNQMRQWPINFRKSRGECLDGRDGIIVRKPLENF